MDVVDHLIYRTDPWLQGAVLFTAFVVAAEIGYRLGRRRLRTGPTGGLLTMVSQAAVLGILGLLLGFSYAAAQSRFDARRHLAVEEANAIGTTWLRAQMLPGPERDRAQELLREYARQRVVRSRAEAEQAITRSEQIHDELWAVARDVAERGTDPPVVLLFTQTLNEMIDLHTTRLHEHLYRTPPRIVLLLDLAALLSMLVAGYASGLDGHRYLVSNLILAALVAIALVITLDLEQPQRGALQPSFAPLIELERKTSAV